MSEDKAKKEINWGELLKKMLHKFIKWLFFSVFIALLPVTANYMFLYLKNAQGTSLSIASVVNNGELIIISVGMAGAAIGELFAWDTTLKSIKYLLGGSCVIILGLSCFLFVYINSFHTTLDIERIYQISRYIFIGSLFSSGFGVTLTEIMES